MTSPTEDFITAFSTHPNKPTRELLEPDLTRETQLRELFKNDPSNPILSDPTVGLVPIYAGKEEYIRIKARDVSSEDEAEKGRYILSLDTELPGYCGGSPDWRESGDRKATGEPAIVKFEQFKTNFESFCNGALNGIDWTNITVAGGAVLLPLLGHKSPLQISSNYDHDPNITEDINLFLHNTDEKSVLTILESFEETIQTNIRRRTMCVRTKNAITILSRDPHIPIRISLRLYRSVSEILHNIDFDIDCACVAYDGAQVYALPRAVASWMTQCNTIRDVHSSWGRYEHRLLKWRFRGFEVYHPKFDRRKVLPGLERMEMGELRGLARLLVFEKYGNADQHTGDLRVNQRQYGIPVDHVAWDTMKEVDWGVPIVEDVEGEGEEGGGGSRRHREHCDECFRRQDEKPRINASEIEEVIYKNDEILNDKKGKAQEDRAGYLHRHRAFVGSMRYIFKDCCKRCPAPQSKYEKNMQAQDDKVYIRGVATFTDEEYAAESEGAWTETAIMADNAALFDIIVAQDANAIRKWIDETKGNIQSNDDTSAKSQKFIKRLNGRDATNRTALQLAVICSSPEIVTTLLDAGASMAVQTIDGRNLLHLAAARGNAEVMRVLLLKNEENETHLEDGARIKTRRLSSVRREDSVDDKMDIDKTSDIDGESFYDVSGTSVTSSFVHIEGGSENPDGNSRSNMGFNEIIDINMPDKANNMAPLHYAIFHGHTDIVKLLVSDFGADILLPIKKLIEIKQYSSYMEGADAELEDQPGLLPLCLPLHLNKTRREDMLRILLKSGAFSAQCDAVGIPALLRMIQQSDIDALKIIFEEDGASALTTARTLYYTEQGVTNALITAIIEGYEDKALFLLEKGVPPIITAEAYNNAFPKTKQGYFGRDYERYCQQPAELALEAEMLDFFMKCIEDGIDPSGRVTAEAGMMYGQSPPEMTFLDLISEKFEDTLTELSVLPKQMVELPDGHLLGSYDHWMAIRSTEEQNQLRKAMNKRHHKFELFSDFAIGERKERLKELLGRYRKLAKWLVERGGRPKSTIGSAKATLAISQRLPEESMPPQLQIFAKFANFEKAMTKTAPGELTMAEYLKIFDRQYVEEPDSDIIPSYHAKEDELTQKIYHKLFTAVWDGDKEQIENLIKLHSRKDADSPWLDLQTTNRFHHNILTLALYKEHSKEILDLIKAKAAEQNVSLEESEAYSRYKYPRPSQGAKYVPREPWSLHYDGPSGLRFCMTDILPRYPTLILQQDIKTLEDQIEKNGILAILHREIIEENVLPDNQIDAKGAPASFDTEMDLDLDSQGPDIFVDDKVHLPFALFAAYQGSHGVYDWLLTDGPENALRKYQQRLEAKVYKRDSESSMGFTDDEIIVEKKADAFFLQILRKADSDTIKHWMGVNHPLIIHAACMKQLNDKLSDDEKIKWYENNIRQFLSRVGEQALEASNHKSEGLTPLLAAAKIRNVWAMRALMNVGAKVDYASPALGFILLNNVLLDRTVSKLAQECLSMVPRDYVNWTFRQYCSVDSYILRMVSSLHHNSQTEPLRLALEYSGDMGIDFVDPESQNPIHILANDQFSIPEDLQIILDAVNEPEMLIRENKNGMTPLDQAAASLYHGILSTRIRKVPATGLADSSSRYSDENTGNSPKIRAGEAEATPFIDSPCETEGKIAGPSLRHGDWGTEEGQSSVVQNWTMISTANKQALERVDKGRILPSSKLEFDAQALKIWESRNENYVVPKKESFIYMFKSSWRNADSGNGERYCDFVKPGVYTTRHGQRGRNILIQKSLARKAAFERQSRE
ncbi:hypothetical protein TWF694_004212 [Orbilia ellipsospora]|uniref:Ankyrin repeat protein n=1 Tax=Orbilia ellipsospora TaxID=2528407 RepID=A0AAV9WZJ6_9PEZI